jgi:ubiquinone/menaquinone biosynthesis C-methylase UbiE
MSVNSGWPCQPETADAVTIRCIEGGDRVSEPEYVLGRTAGEYDRLIEQAEVMRPLAERMLHSAGVRPGMRVLDVGCGVGDVSFLVSEIVGEHGSVVGVDVDRAALEVADGRRAASGIGNVEFRAGNIGCTEFDREFDAVVGRFVLMFIDDPTAVLRRLRKALRPGGIVAFQEWVGDVHGVSPATQPLLSWVLGLLAETFVRSGAHLHMGLELYTGMLEAGFEPDPTPIAEIGLHTGDQAPGARRWALFARSMLPKIVEYGLATEAEIEVETLERRLRDEYRNAGGMIPLTWLMVGQWAHKPERL